MQKSLYIPEAWRASGGPSQEEQDQYINGAIKSLGDPEQVVQFQQNVEEVGVWANDVDAAFDRVTRGFVDIVAKYGKDFPGLSAFLADWKTYNTRWVALLLLSRNVASEQIGFDQVFLDLIETIKTEKDRLDAITELQSFIDEDHSQPGNMAEGFMDLKNDIDDFVVRFDAYVAEKGAELEQQAKSLQAEIDVLRAQIMKLDLEILAATVALLAGAEGAATLIGILGVIVAGTILAVKIGERSNKSNQLSRKRKELEEVNRKQVALAHLATDFNGLRPDISLVCDKLVMFGEIWQSVRSQSIRFQTHLKLGMEAVHEERFLQEIELARDTCPPLEEGLLRYATKLENRA
ncbi:hypothetical protein MD484_g8367, partial [Candolleomyces efflorescens]